jgi:DNA-binding LacI/PurR family transcriptional regulator
MDPLRTRPTSTDVAREAGVSRATVSYVLNDTPHQKIPENTRRRVREAALQLGYTPSAAARVLRSGRSDVVLLLLPDWPIGPAVGALLEELSATLAEAGLTFVAHPTARSTRSVSEVWKAITPAAVVAFSEFDEQELIIGLLGHSSSGGYELEQPQQWIGRRQVEHLVAAGHRRLGYAWDPDPRVQAFVRSRLDGARQACAELGLDEPDVQAVPLDPVAAANAVDAWRSTTPPVTAVCAYNDETALALLAGLRGRGLTAPADLAVIGVDDIPAAILADPPLTTVVADQGAAAEHIAHSIVAALHGEPAPTPPGPESVHLICRESA